MAPDQPARPPGRPRKWSSEAERKRAYRRRRAQELSEPMGLRETAKAAQSAASDARAEAAAATAEAERWRRRAQAAEKDAKAARVQARRERQRAQRSTAERDEAQRLLRRKLQMAGRAADTPAIRDDPAALLAIIAELHPELERLRRENKRLRTPAGWRLQTMPYTDGGDRPVEPPDQR